MPERSAANGCRGLWADSDFKVDASHIYSHNRERCIDLFIGSLFDATRSEGAVIYKYPPRPLAALPRPSSDPEGSTSL